MTCDEKILKTRSMPCFLPSNFQLFSFLRLIFLLTCLCTPSSPSFNRPLKEEKERMSLYKDCEKQLGSHFTKSEKGRICSLDNNFTVSSLCASEVRKEFRNTPFDDIITLCSFVDQSLDHLTCLRAMTPTERLADGIQLCKYPTSSHSSVTCYRDLIVSNKSLKNKRSGDNLRERDEIMSFCSSVTSEYQVQCYQKAAMYGFGRSDSSIDIVPTICSYVTDGFMDECLMGLKSRIGWNDKNMGRVDQHKLMLHRDTFEFCTQARTLNEVKCYNHTLESVRGDADSSQLSAHMIKVAFSNPYQNRNTDMKKNDNLRLELCKGSASEAGPIECLNEFHKRVKGKNSERVGVSLCSQASTSSPAVCYIDAPSSLKEDGRLKLCHRASDTSPIDCFKSIKKVSNVNQMGDDLIVATCSLATNHSSSGISSCFNNAPKFLSSPEKVTLCRQSIDAGPTQCIQHIESFSRLITKTHQVNDEDFQVKGRLIAMCSGDNRNRIMSPMKTAQCFQSLYGKMGILDGIRVCSKMEVDVPSDDFFGYVPACLQLLNMGVSKNLQGQGEWTFLHAAILCAPVSGASSTTNTEISRMKQAAACAHTTLKSLYISRDQAVDICKGDENQVENRLMCIQTANRRQTSGAGAKAIDLEMLLSLCSNQDNTIADAKESLYIAGECISQITSGYINDIPRLYLQWSTKTMRTFCTEASLRFNSRNELASRFNCIVSVTKGLVSSYDVSHCLDAIRYIESAKVVSLRAEYNQITVTAGQWFSLDVLVFDNFYTPMKDLNEQYITLSINEQNPQGAVLWGRVINATINGTVNFDRLVLTQPGDVRLFISASFHGEKKKIGSYFLTVDIDEDKKSSSLCLFIFNQGVEIIGYNNQYHVLSVQYFWIFLSCMDLFDEWFIYYEVSFDRIIFEYKPGIESIWTGRGLPSFAMSHYERLGLDEARLPTSLKATRKFLRKAYYQMSLKWHPDRWVSMPIYSMAVHQVFEIISESYKILSVETEHGSTLEEGIDEFEVGSFTTDM